MLETYLGLGVRILIVNKLPCCPCCVCGKRNCAGEDRVCPGTRTNCCSCNNCWMSWKREKKQMLKGCDGFTLTERGITLILEQYQHIPGVLHSAAWLYLRSELDWLRKRKLVRRRRWDRGGGLFLCALRLALWLRLSCLLTGLLLGLLLIGRVGYMRLLHSCSEELRLL